MFHFLIPPRRAAKPPPATGLGGAGVLTSDAGLSKLPRGFAAGVCGLSAGLEAPPPNKAAIGFAAGVYGY